MRSDNLSIFSAIRENFEARGLSKGAGFKARHSYYGVLSDTDGTIDDVIFTAYSAPHSYTGEDSFEISAHGNPLIVKRILSLLYTLGFRLAAPGEFTRRAYLHGKMGISAAAAVSEIIEARNHLSLAAAKRLKQGTFRTEILKLRSLLMNVLADLNAELDFIDEDITFASREQKLALLKEVENEASSLKDAAERFEQIKDGIRIAIVGQPNAGKSSLMNRLLGQNRAIVSSIAGTTRDFIEAELEIQGMNIRLFDTAGLRESSPDPIEQMGIERTRELVGQSHLCLHIIDASAPPTDADLWQTLGLQTEARRLVVFNKADIRHAQRGELPPGANSYSISATSGAGVDALLAGIGEVIQTLAPENALPLGVWQREILSQIASGCVLAQDALQAGELPEVVTHLVHQAVEGISKLTGEVTSEDILGRIFSRFCVGK